MTVSNLVVRAFHPDDYARIQGQEHLTIPYLSYPAMLEKLGRAVTWTVNGQPVACAGLVRVWPTTAEAWTVVSPTVRETAREFHYSVKRFLQLGWDVMRLHRIQTYVAADQPQFERWAKACGFRREGYLVAWGPQREDYLMMARVA